MDSRTQTMASEHDQDRARIKAILQRWPFAESCEHLGADHQGFCRGCANAALRLLGETSVPDFWRCLTCGCMWRDNHDGTVSLGGPTQKSCVECEGDTSKECEPLYREVAHG
jgi:hypothetical protein